MIHQIIVDEAAHSETAAQDVPQELRGRDQKSAAAARIESDEPADRNPREAVEQRLDGCEDKTARILEIDVDPVGAGSGKPGFEIGAR